ncbi:MAG: helix-turn-helix domain-containing protein [Pseudonocardiaceae bacterium]
MPAVQQAAAAGQYGARIRITRMARRLTLAQAGKLVRYSASTISRIETGRRKVTDVTELRLFASAFDIPPHLFGLTLSTVSALPYGVAPPSSAVAPTTVGDSLREGGDAAMWRRQVLSGLVGVTGTALLGGSARPPGTHAAPHLQTLLAGDPGRAVQPVGAQVLRARLGTAHTTFHACRYHELAVTLPDVIATAQTSLDEATGQQHDQTAALLADAYSLASELCIKLRDDALAWVTAERARSAAQTSGDVASIAEAARMAAIALRRHGHHDTAITLLTSTALDLGVDSGDPVPERLATYGSLLCTASYTAAQHGNRSGALELITEAEAPPPGWATPECHTTRSAPPMWRSTGSGCTPRSVTLAPRLTTPGRSTCAACRPPNARPDAAWTPPAPGIASAAPATASRPCGSPSGAPPKNSADRPCAP